MPPTAQGQREVSKLADLFLRQVFRKLQPDLGKYRTLLNSYGRAPDIRFWLPPQRTELATHNEWIAHVSDNPNTTSTSTLLVYELINLWLLPLNDTINNQYSSTDDLTLLSREKIALFKKRLAISFTLNSKDRFLKWQLPFWHPFWGKQRAGILSKVQMNNYKGV